MKTNKKQKGSTQWLLPITIAYLRPSSASRFKVEKSAKAQIPPQTICFFKTNRTITEPCRAAVRPMSIGCSLFESMQQIKKVIHVQCIIHRYKSFSSICDSPMSHLSELRIRCRNPIVQLIRCQSILFPI
jgi:hypothetical protein